MMDYMQTILGTLELQNTNISSKAITTSATSAGGSQTSFETGRTNKTAVPDVTFPLNVNYKFDFPHMVASSINETNELSSLRSYQTELSLTSQSNMVSPVIDLERNSIIAVCVLLISVNGTLCA